MRYFLIKKLKLLQVVMQNCHKAQWYIVLVPCDLKTIFLEIKKIKNLVA